MTAEVRLWAVYHTIKIESPRIENRGPLEIVKATSDFVLSHREWLRSVGVVL